MYIQKSFLRLSVFIIKRKLMTKQERFISETIALNDRNLQSMINKSDQSRTLLLQTIFDRQIQEYIHRCCQIPIDIHDRYIYRLNSMIIHHPNEFDLYKNLSDKNRFREDHQL